MTQQETILVLDFGAQYSQLIARRVREAKVYSQILPYYADLETIKSFNPKGIILSGGPASVMQEGSPRPDPGVFTLGVPVLGICYGLQVMTIMHGGQVERPQRREYGYAHLDDIMDTPLLEGITQGSVVWMSHGDAVAEPGSEFSVLAGTENCRYAVLAHEQKGLYGVQFHPEVVHTEQGARLLSNFVHHICGCSSSWTIESFIDMEVKRIRDTVGDRQVLCGLSGGVDSSVTAALIHRAIGDQLVCVFVNNGLLRKGEEILVQKVFRDSFHMRLEYVDAQKEFLSELEGVTDPETKRKIIGRVFIEVFEHAARSVGTIDILAQGTLYPDVIESVSATGGPSATIKSHHNVGGLPEDLRFSLLEPLRELFKDEVRELGRELGLPEEIVGRHPFPGPGLGVRCVGEVSSRRLDTLREADAIFIEEIRHAGLYEDVWQALVCLLPVKSVGVQGDERTYEEVCSLRAVTSEDAMTADWFRFPPELLQRVSSRIINEVEGINRVLYDVTSKPPGTIEWE